MSRKIKLAKVDESADDGGASHLERFKARKQIVATLQRCGKPLCATSFFINMGHLKLNKQELIQVLEEMVLEGILQKSKKNLPNRKKQLEPTDFYDFFGDDPADYGLPRTLFGIPVIVDNSVVNKDIKLTEFD